jgi:flagellar M-ring protein FliF
VNSFLETLKQIGPARLSIMGAIVLGLLVFFVFISLRVSVPELSLLYSDLSTADSASVAGKLEESEIIYEISPDGEKVYVPENEVGRARMLLAEAGLPNGGSLGYELFDADSGFGTTNFVQNINQVRALEGELARTIISLENIRSARVHLVLPQRELFSREQRTSSASVFLGVRPGIQIEKEKILAIQSLVASAVPDLKPSNVSVIDSNGNLLANKEIEGVDQMAVKAEEMRLKYESRLIDKIEDQVNRVVGYGKVRATVTAEINFDRISMNEELYDPEGQVVRSTQVTEESGLEREAAPEDVSVGNNLPGVGGDLLSGTQPSSENERIEELTNFEISKTIRNTVREVGEVKKLSVAVLVDGRYTTNEAGERIYEARPQEELDQISTLIRSAVGFDEERGDQIEVINLQFAQIDTNEGALDIAQFYGFDKNKLLDVAEIVTVAIMIILVVLLVLQPMVNKLLDSGMGAARADDSIETELLTSSPLSPALTGPRDDDHGEEESLINIHGVDGKVKASSLKKVEEIIDNYPKEALSVIRSWMTQE